MNLTVQQTSGVLVLEDLNASVRRDFIVMSLKNVLTRMNANKIIIATRMPHVLIPKEAIIAIAKKVFMEMVFHAYKVSAVMILVPETKHVLRRLPRVIVQTVYTKMEKTAMISTSVTSALMIVRKIHRASTMWEVTHVIVSLTIRKRTADASMVSTEISMTLVQISMNVALALITVRKSLNA